MLRHILCQFQERPKVKTVNDATIMNPEPDYSTYPLEDLRDLVARVDRERFPDRYAKITREIRRREIVSRELQDIMGEEPPAPRPSRFWLFVAHALAGLVFGSLLYTAYVWKLYDNTHGRSDRILAMAKQDQGLYFPLLATLLGCLVAVVSPFPLRKPANIAALCILFLLVNGVVDFCLSFALAWPGFC